MLLPQHSSETWQVASKRQQRTKQLCLALRPPACPARRRRPSLWERRALAAAACRRRRHAPRGQQLLQLLIHILHLRLRQAIPVAQAGRAGKGRAGERATAWCQLQDGQAGP